jgi:predicted MFS family arabinose efflux permease
VTAAITTTDRRARVVVTGAFVAHGMLFGAWVARIPSVKADLHLSAGALGLALLAPALGTILAARAIGTRTARHGSAFATRWFGVANCAAGWLVGLAGNLPELFVTLLFWGAVMGAADVGMNAQGVTVEGRYGRPVLSSMHAWFSIGTFVGALLGGGATALGVSLLAQQAVIGAVLGLGLLLAGTVLLPDPSYEPIPRRPLLRLPRRPQPRLVLLGAAALCALLAEGAASDWSGVLLRDTLGVAPSHAGFGYAAFAAAMTCGRFAGDRIVHALGRPKAFALLALIGTVGMSFGLAVQTVGTTVAGFALLGLGLSAMVPTLFSTAADVDAAAGPAIAAVSAIGCVGLLVGPSMIGGLAQLFSVPGALVVLPPITALAGLLGIAGARLTMRERNRVIPA